jgi:hypothetical protein
VTGLLGITDPFLLPQLIKISKFYFKSNN